MANWADEIWWYFPYLIPKIGFDISCRWSPVERICIKCQSQFSGKILKNISKCCLLQFLPSMLSAILGNPGVTHYGTLHFSPLGQLAYVSLSSWIINEDIWLVISVFPWEILIYFCLAYSANNVIVLCLFCEYPIISFVASQAWY